MIALNEGNLNGKERYYQRETWAKVHTKYLRLLLMKFQNHYQLWDNQAQEFLNSLRNLKRFHK